MHVLVVDDDFGSRVGVAYTLAQFYPQATVSQASSLFEAQAVLGRDGAVDLVLLDLNLLESRGLDTLRALKAWCEVHDVNPRIVVLSAGADYDDSLIPEAIENCATGFVTKGTSMEVFRSAVDLTLAGGIFIPERYLAKRRKPAGTTARGASYDGIPHFTPREREVAALLLRGYTYKQIARQLCGAGEQPLSDHTVRVHVQRMAWKLRMALGQEDSGLTAKAIVLTAMAQQRFHSEEARATV